MEQKSNVTLEKYRFDGYSTCASIVLQLLLLCCLAFCLSVCLSVSTTLGRFERYRVQRG